VRKVIVFVNSSIDGLMGGRAGNLGWLVDDEVDHDLPPTAISRFISWR